MLQDNRGCSSRVKGLVPLEAPWSTSLSTQKQGQWGVLPVTVSGVAAVESQTAVGGKLGFRSQFTYTDHTPTDSSLVHENYVWLEWTPSFALPHSLFTEKERLTFLKPRTLRFSFLKMWFFKDHLLAEVISQQLPFFSHSPSQQNAQEKAHTRPQCTKQRIWRVACYLSIFSQIQPRLALGKNTSFLEVVGLQSVGFWET